MPTINFFLWLTDFRRESFYLIKFLHHRRNWKKFYCLVDKRKVEEHQQEILLILKSLWDLEELKGKSQAFYRKILIKELFAKVDVF